MKSISLNLPLFVMTVVAFISCDSGHENTSLETISFTHSNQSFEIVLFYNKMPIYIKKGYENRRDTNRLYYKYVYEPIMNDFAAKGECAFLAKFISYPILNLDGLTTEVNALQKSDVGKMVEVALRKVADVLPGPKTTIYLQAIDPDYKKYTPAKLQTGVVAYTFGSGRIFIAIDPTAINWQLYLRKVVAHEYHHSVWIQRNFTTANFSLLEYLILEGRADNFANLIYPDIESPWTELFSTEKEKEVWSIMKKNLNKRDAEFNMKMVMGDMDIPMGSAYTIGYKIIKSFLKFNPNVSTLEWTDMTPEDILAKSKYENKLN